MSTVTPQGENTRKAVKWISARLQENPEQKIWKLIEEAISIYDLNPFESESLMQFYKKNKD